MCYNFFMKQHKSDSNGLASSNSLVRCVVRDATGHFSWDSRVLYGQPVPNGHENSRARMRALHERLVVPQRSELGTRLEAEASADRRRSLSEMIALPSADAAEADGDVGEQSSDSSETEPEVFSQNAPVSIPDARVFLAQDYEQRRDPLDQVLYLFHL